MYLDRREFSISGKINILLLMRVFFLNITVFWGVIKEVLKVLELRFECVLKRRHHHNRTRKLFV